jgi:hypothetical protein
VLQFFVDIDSLSLSLIANQDSLRGFDQYKIRNAWSASEVMHFILAISLCYQFCAEFDDVQVQC